MTTAVANTAREQQRAEKAEAERDAMRPVVEAACSYADLGHRPTLHDYEHRSGDKRIKEAVDAYREATRG